MGIEKLLTLVDDAFIDTNLSDPAFKGKRAGIDTSIWLYKSLHQVDSFSRWKEAVTTCKNLVALLKINDIIPLFVFDGQRLPAKLATHQKRAEVRRKLREKVENMKKEEAELRCKGKTAEASEILDHRKNVELGLCDVRQIGEEFLDYLAENKIDFIVAPFEADAQLASLCQENIIDFVLTEDSDLIAYDCPRIVYKLDFSGFCRFYDRDRLPEALGQEPEQFEFSRFLDMCVLTGSDYYPSILGIGIISAKKLSNLAQKKNIDICGALRQYSRGEITSINSNFGKLKGEDLENYLLGFTKAKLTFNHQVIYSVINNKFEYLKPLPEILENEDIACLGDLMNQVNTMDYVCGNINPFTLSRNGKSYNPSISDCPRESIWHSDYVANPVINTIDPQPQERPPMIKRQKPKTYSCDECGHSVIHKFSLKQHFEMHRGVKHALCDICGVAFVQMEHLKLHQLTHGTDYKYHCDYEDCTRKFHSLQNLNRHKQVHTGEKPYLCPFADCAKKYSSAKSVKNHVFGNHCDIKEFVCEHPDCGKAFVSNQILGRHQIIHVEVKKFVCNVCGKGFHHAAFLKKHLPVHSDLRPYKCDVCDELFKTAYCLSLHRVKHFPRQKHKCNHCGNEYFDPSVLKRHLIACKKITKVNCSVCRKAFSSPLLLKEHGNTHPKFSCIKCRREFWDPKKFAKHKSRCKGLSKLICSKCNKGFAYAAGLRRHINICKGDNWYIKCPHCSLTFYPKYNLDVHVKEVHGNKKKTKSSNKKFTCPHCDRKYKYMSVVDLHCKKHHQKRFCNMCGKSFWSFTSMMSHITDCNGRVFVDR